MKCVSDLDLSDIRTFCVDFGDVHIYEVSKKPFTIINDTKKTQNYQIYYMYNLNNMDEAFSIESLSEEVKPRGKFEINISFQPQVGNYSYVEYYLIDDSVANLYRLMLTGRCTGKTCYFDKNKLTFTIIPYKNVFNERTQTLEITNPSERDVKYQWVSPETGLGVFQVCSNLCGTVKAKDKESISITFTANTAGFFSAELVCLLEYQEPLILQVFGTLIFPGTSIENPAEHLPHDHEMLTPYGCYMENCLDFLPYIPAASMYDRYLNFGSGNVEDASSNVSQTVCVTNQYDLQARYEWIADPEKIFVVDPVEAAIPPKSSKQFTVRFRPKTPSKSYGHILCGCVEIEKRTRKNKPKLRHVWFRLPCIGNTWGNCAEREANASWECRTKVIMPPAAPGIIVFSNFVLTNKMDTPMTFTFNAPQNAKFVLMPMCGNIAGREWQIVCVAFQPDSIGYFCENWRLVINNKKEMRLALYASSEKSVVRVLSQGFSPFTDAMIASSATIADAIFTFPATVTDTCSCVVSHLHNLTRMPIHIRALNHVAWLGADYGGSLVVQPNEIKELRWWFYPKESDRVYETNVTCTCVCLIDDLPVGEPTEVVINFSGFSEHASIKVLPQTLNLHDVVVDSTAHYSLTLFNFGSCAARLRLSLQLDGLGDDHSADEIELYPKTMTLKPSEHFEVKGKVTPRAAGPRQISLRFRVLYRFDLTNELVSLEMDKKTICKIWYDGIYPTIKVYRTISVKCPVALTGHCLWNVMNIDELNKAFADCRPRAPLTVTLYAPDLHAGADPVEVVLVLGCVFAVEVPFSMKRVKLCDCEMVEVPLGINLYTMRHTCFHRAFVLVESLDGVVTPTSPILMKINLEYAFEGKNVLGFEMKLPNDRTILLNIQLTAFPPEKGILTALRRTLGYEEYVAVMDCGRVPINNLDPVIRIVWLYNPTNAFATWRLMRRGVKKNAAIQCILYFAEVPPLSRFGIPIAFLPTEMIDYEEVFNCSFGFNTVKILVRGQGGLPNCFETRLDIPSYVPNLYKAQHRRCVVWLSHDHLTLPVLSTHSLTRELIAMTNNTDHIIRYAWLPERIANIVSIVMTPYWGILHPKSTDWVTMTVFSLQEPATFTISVVCELLDLTERRAYQQNESVRQMKAEQCAQEFIITEEGTTHPDINDFPPYVLDLKYPMPFHLAISVAVCTQGQRDGVTRLKLKQLLEQTPMHELSLEENEDACPFVFGNLVTSNKMPMSDILRIIDGILWNALHSTTMRPRLQYYAKEEIPTCTQLLRAVEKGAQPRLGKRITSGICDAIINQAISEVYGLTPKHHMEILKLQ